MNKNIFYWIVFTVLFIVNVSAVATAKLHVDRYETVRVIAKVKNVEIGKPRTTHVPAAFRRAVTELRRRGFTVIRELPRLALVVLEVDGRGIEKLIDTDLVHRLVRDVPDSPDSHTDSINQIGADIAHNLGFRGNGQTVVILDTGVESTHPYFSGRVVEEACFSSTSSISTSLCSNGLNTQTGPRSASDCSSTGIRGCGHGTFVAGIAAGANQDMRGVAPGALIVAVQVYSEFPATYEGCRLGERCILSWTSDQLCCARMGAQ